MPINVFDVSLYGGLHAEHSQNQILTEYAGKTILALEDELFEYSNEGSRSLLDFIGPQEAQNLVARGTIIMSLQQQKDM